MKKPGTLVISLDFELMWGMFDKVTPNTYGEQIRGVHTAIPRILDLFQQHDIHATWATVGMLLYPDFTSLRHATDKLRAKPAYTNPVLSAYQHLSTLDSNADPALYFAPELAQQISQTPHQEFASHTFSHYYCLEAQAGNVRDAFASDCIALHTATRTFAEPATSIVFPRNQWSLEALQVCAEQGYTAFRGTENHFIYRARNESNKTNILLRGLRFLDRYLNLTGHHTYLSSNLSIYRKVGSLVNIPASRQLHPYSKKLSFLEKLKLQRIKSSMTHAAKRGEVFHLWWHPHNFGVNQTENFVMLTDILKHFSHLQKTYGMQSQNMHELATATV